MIAASPKFRESLKHSHVGLLRVKLYRADEDGWYQFGTVPVSSGTVSMDSTRNVWREVSLTVADDPNQGFLYGRTWSPTELRDLVEDIGIQSSEITIEMGIKYLDGGLEWVQIARLRVEAITRSSQSATLSLTAYDFGARISDFPLITPYAPLDMDGNRLTYVEAITDLINTAHPSNFPATVMVDGALDDTAIPKEGTVLTGDRWAAINTLAQSIGAIVYNDNLGRFRIEPADEPRTPAWTIAAGGGGTFVDATTEYSRTDQFNAVAVRWEQPNGDGGLVYLVDADPDSPTYYDGFFGRKPRPEEQLDTITSEAAAIKAAESLLAQYKGRTRTVNVTCLYNPLLQPLDVVTIKFPDGQREDHVIESLSLPLEGGTMEIKTRMVRT